jgi:hypothetical protein
MGMVRNVKVQTIAKEAARAYGEGHYIFAARLNAPTRLGDMTGSVGDWAEMIEAIEAEGWALANWTVTDAGKVGAYPLFRRRRDQRGYER